MNTARKIVNSLIQRGVIPAEFEEAATRELHCELTRRARRISSALAHVAAINSAVVFFCEE